MKADELFEIRNDKPIVMFNKLIEKTECDFDENMKARLVNMSDAENDCYRLTFDFSEFEEYNKKHEKPNFRDHQDHPILTWSESRFYPANKLETFYIDHDSEIDFLQIIPEPLMSTSPETPHLDNLSKEIDIREEVEALAWVVDQFEKVLQGEIAANVEECLVHAHTILAKYEK
ncbi:MAG: hypothetical protein ACE3L7_33530 [Candidatus Pristimantibacillus sp.]